MSKSLGDLVTYICATYPHKDHLSNARLTKLVYLADWEAVRSLGHQLTDIKWVFNNYGPWVPDVLQAAKSDNRLAIVSSQNSYGSGKVTIAVAEGVDPLAEKLLPEGERLILDSVISDTEALYFGQFIEHVYDTDPVQGSLRHQELDLLQFTKGQARAKTVDFPAQNLTPSEYARVRDQADMAVARVTLGQSFADVVTSYGGPTAEGLTFSQVKLDPRMPVHRTDSATVEVEVSGTATLTGLAPADAEGHLVPPFAGSAYTVQTPDWAPGQAVVALKLGITAKIAVTSSGNRYSAEVLTAQTADRPRVAAPA